MISGGPLVQKRIAHRRFAHDAPPMHRLESFDRERPSPDAGARSIDHFPAIARETVAEGGPSDHAPLGVLPPDRLVAARDSRTALPGVDPTLKDQERVLSMPGQGGLRDLPSSSAPGDSEDHRPRGRDQDLCNNT